MCLVVNNVFGTDARSVFGTGTIKCCMHFFTFSRSDNISPIGCKMETCIKSILDERAIINIRSAFQSTMSEVFFEEGNGVSDHFTQPISTTTDAETQNMSMGNATSDFATSTPDFQAAKNSIASTAIKKTKQPAFLHYTNVLTVVIAVAMFISLIYGILSASGAFDQDNNNTGSKSNRLTATSSAPIAAATSAPVAIPSVAIRPASPPVAVTRPTSVPVVVATPSNAPIAAAASTTAPVVLVQPTNHPIYFTGYPVARPVGYGY
jgi:hypothetical protein